MISFLDLGRRDVRSRSAYFLYTCNICNTWNAWKLVSEDQTLRIFVKKIVKLLISAIRK